jgi:hypothetical protein
VNILDDILVLLHYEITASLRMVPLASLISM